MDMRLKQYTESKKVFKVEEKKKSETSEQRARRYSPFKALFVGGLLATAGMVESHPLQSESRSLANRNVTRPEFDPGPVTPELLDHLRKVGVKKPEELVRNALAGIYEGQEEQNKQIAALIERDQIDPEVSRRSRQMFEVMSPADAPAVSFASEDTPPPPPPPEPSLKCLSVDSSYITAHPVDTVNIPGRGLRLLEYLRVRNNCPTNSYLTGFFMYRIFICPPHTERLRIIPKLDMKAAMPDTVAPGQEVPAYGSPIDVTYQCIAKHEHSYSPSYLFDVVYAKGYASFSRENTYTAPFKFQALPGETYPPIAQSTKASSRARTALLWGAVVGAPLFVAPYVQW